MTSGRARLAPAGLALVLFVAASCNGGPERLVFENAPVILISIDTLRSDRLPVYGYGAGATPAIDALARDAILFERAYSHYPLTLPSHASILSGLLPPRHGVRDNVGYPFDGAQHATLARRFAAARYDTGGFVSAFVLRRDTGIADGFADFDDALVAEEGQGLDAVQRPGAETTRLALDWLARRGERPFFLFLHLYEPHAPYLPPPPFAGRFAEPYDGEVAAADDCVGRLLAALRARGLYDRSIVVLLSDHGEALGDHGGQTHGVFLYREALQVPLLLKLPGARHAGTRVAAPARLVDVYSTLLGLAGLEVPPNDGAPLLDLLSPETPPRQVYAETFYPRIHFGWSALSSMIEGRFHYIHGPDPELYDLETDSRELRSVLPAERRAASGLRQALAVLDRPLAPPEATDAETARRLAALGYLAGATQPSDGRPLPDPKSQTATIQRLEAAYHAFDHGDYTAAAQGFRSLVEENPRMADAWPRLGLSLQRLGRHEEAIAVYERAAALAPAPGEFEVPLATSLLALGRLDEARGHAERGRTFDPAGAYDTLLRVALAKGDLEAGRALVAEAGPRGIAVEPLRRRFALGLIAAGRPQEALRELDGLAGSKDPATQLAIATALASAGLGTEASQILESLLASRPDDARALAMLGTLATQAGNFEQARAALTRALAIDGGLPTAWDALGLTLYRLRRPVEALDAWQQAAARDPQQVEPLFNIGLVAQELGRREESRRALRSFVARAPAERYAEQLREARRLLRQPR